MRRELVDKSKFLSLILRHDPSVVEIVLDASGWVDIDGLLVAIQKKQPDFSRAIFDEIVASNDKKRFIVSDDGLRVRAAHGHSIGVSLELTPMRPPDQLFHGTADRFLDSIRAQGLVRRQRDYVHLSPDAETARNVGMRHGRPVILIIQTVRIFDEGHLFYQSDSGIWLTESVPVPYIRFP